ncbi:MAG: hypothetical protein QOJ32_1152 [Frankiaceae bacterium]|nr:hypothetical protein [Frankiaceae bacterium]MDQ1650369.1 hypothetical protein [Frankiaceae bacterium]MDQ1672850.1 hypothetical protein [Frankiaceae bacterium]
MTTRWLLVPLLVGALSACSFDIEMGQRPGTGAAAPPCRLSDGQTDGSLVLMAQSVPTASVLPCLRRLPEGWTVGGYSAHNGRARLWLVVGSETRTALTVTLQKRCDLDEFAEVQSDVGGTLRFERQTSSAATLSGSRAYVYPGSCLRYDYALLDATALPVLQMAIGTIDRASIAAHVAQDTRSRLQLDPSARRTS